MTSVLIFPYQTPSVASITEPVWTADGSPIDSVDLTGSDYYARIIIRCSVAVDCEELQRSTRLPATDMTFVMTARSESAGLFRILAQESIVDGEVVLEGALEASEVGDLARLQIQLVRTSGVAATADRLTAKKKGAVLWGRNEKLRFSGVGSRLSVQATDFSNDPTRRGVLWQIEIDCSDAQLSVSSAAVVRLNSRHPELIALLQSTDDQDLAGRIVRRQLQLDVARQFVNSAREIEKDEDPDALAALPYDSIGAVALRFSEKVRIAAGLPSRSDLWSLYETNLSAFEVIMQTVYLAPAIEVR